MATEAISPVAEFAITSAMPNDSNSFQIIHLKKPGQGAMPKVAMNSGSADRASVRQAATLRASAREYGRGDHETGSTELGDVGDTRPVLIGMPTLAVNGQSQLDSSHTRFPAASQVAHRSRGERVARFPNVSSFALLFEPSVDARRICVPGFSASSMTGVSSTLLNDVTDLLKQIASPDHRILWIS